jgi:hypothetical protein
MGCSKERRGNPKREEVLRDKAGWAGLPWLPHILVSSLRIHKLDSQKNKLRKKLLLPNKCTSM